MRTFAAALAFAGALTWVAAAPAPRDDHGDAIAAMADVRAATTEIVGIEDGNAVGRPAYVRAAHRALNALVGRTDDGYARAFGDPGDGIGALGHVDKMLDQAGTPRWTPAVEGAKANLLAAAQSLQSAIDERGMDDYQIDVSRALASLALVVGRPSQDGVLGGLSGALANTDLGVPAGGVRVSGCSIAAGAPAYGVVAGKLVYVALPRVIAAAGVPEGLDVRRVVVHGSDVVLYTGAGSSAPGCPVRSKLQRTAEVTRGLPALYTRAQARSGALVYAAHCIQCHGTNLQGTAGPAVAGTEFLKSAKFDGWTLEDVRTTVFQNMPFSNPGSLTAKQYADVMAFLLASNCFPAGSKPFPQADLASFAKIKLGPIASVSKSRSKLGVCAVK